MTHSESYGLRKRVITSKEVLGVMGGSKGNGIG